MAGVGHRSRFSGDGVIALHDQRVVLRLESGLILVALLASGCASAGAHPPRARDEAAWPSGDRFHGALVQALRDPGTWIPAAGAAVMTVDDWDAKISRWAVETTPLFGSPERADRWSDRFRAATDLGMIATALSTTGGEPVWSSRLQRLVVEEAGTQFALQTTNILKDVTGRERPDGSDDASFPSGHSTKASSYAAFGSRNLDLVTWPDGARTATRAGLFTLSGATAWARVEAGKHYPSDVLAGAALGNFIARLIHDTFLRRAGDVALDVRLDRDSVSLSLTLGGRRAADGAPPP